MKRYAGPPLLLVLLGISACIWDKRAATSGQIGCAPSEIVISDEESSRSARTWTATCDDNVYYCSVVATGTETSQVSCHSASHPSTANPTVATANTVNAVEAPEHPAAPLAPAPVASAPGAAEQGPPKAVAGFDFGSTVTEASSACTEHGYEWQPGTQDHFSCSNTPVSLGIEAVPTIRFCKEKLCAVSLSVLSRNAWLAAYAKFTDTLTKKYGRPATSWGELRRNCGTEPEFEACIMTGGLKLTREWKWDKGSKISLRLLAGETEPQMTIVYIRQQQQQRELVPDAL